MLSYNPSKLNIGVTLCECFNFAFLYWCRCVNAARHVGLGLGRLMNWCPSTNSHVERYPMPRPWNLSTAPLGYYTSGLKGQRNKIMILLLLINHHQPIIMDQVEIISCTSQRLKSDTGHALFTMWFILLYTISPDFGNLILISHPTALI